MALVRGPAEQDSTSAISVFPRPHLFRTRGFAQRSASTRLVLLVITRGNPYPHWSPSTTMGNPLNVGARRRGDGSGGVER
jgi:hypothetical protein